MFRRFLSLLAATALSSVILGSAAQATLAVKVGGDGGDSHVNPFDAPQLFIPLNLYAANAHGGGAVRLALKIFLRPKRGGGLHIIKRDNGQIYIFAPKAKLNREVRFAHVFRVGGRRYVTLIVLRRTASGAIVPGIKVMKMYPRRWYRPVRTLRTSGWIEGAVQTFLDYKYALVEYNFNVPRKVLARIAIRNFVGR